MDQVRPFKIEERKKSLAFNSLGVYGKKVSFIAECSFISLKRSKAVGKKRAGYKDKKGIFARKRGRVGKRGLRACR